MEFNNQISTATPLPNFEEALSYLRSCPKTLDACNFLLDGFSGEDLGDSGGAKDVPGG